MTRWSVGHRPLDQLKLLNSFFKNSLISSRLLLYKTFITKITTDMETRNNHALIQALLDCALACEHCASSCLKEEDINMMIDCIKLDRDCADICTQAARLLQRDSVIAHQYLLLCEEICRLCAAECSKHDHEHCRQCAVACEECADACHANHEPINQD
ncbi:uncharacterized protein DUF326 [Pedobacter alluvionis]|uniref:Uncharacterized protein DUF326 n=2 Tax=Pedobacter alluvionis TaxID=475253 RepID=A0A497YBV0_9SPHI|nr:uncharacterized protein DUF326 [Pedobacter alluvionis]